MPREGILALVLPWTLTAACAIEALPDPTLLSVCRADVQETCDQVAYAGLTLEVLLIGDNLHPTYLIDLDSTEPIAAVGVFRAWIGDVELEDVALVRREEASPLPPGAILRGRLPGRLAAGLHEAAVETPAGLRASREAAFRLRSPLLVDARLEKTRLPVGDLNQLVVTLENPSPTVLEQVELTLSQTGDGHFLEQQGLGAFRLEAVSSQTASLPLVAELPGSATLALSATGMADTVAVVASAEVYARITAQAALEVSASAPPEVPLGDAVTLAVAVKNAGGSTLSGVDLGPLSMSGAGFIAWEPPQERHLTLTPGAEVTFYLFGLADRPGDLQVALSVSGVEEISDRPVSCDLDGIPIRVLGLNP